MNMVDLKKIVFFVLMVFSFSIFDMRGAQAGFLDKINAAAKKLNEKTQQMQQKSQGEDPDQPLHLENHYKGSCEGRRSATCMDYGELVGQCMDPLKGYRMKLLGDLIEKKLKTETLSDQQRKNLEEDLEGIREAQKNKSDDPTIAGEPKSQRYLSDISEEDQICVNADYGVFYKKIYNKCMGADHMGIGKRTEMMKEEALGCEEALLQYRANQKKENDSMSCMRSVTALRYEIMAQMMEKKMQTLKLSSNEKAQWQEDIAAVRKVAEEGGMAMPKVNDPTNPMRPMTRLISAEEQTELNNAYLKQSQERMAECQNAGKSSAKSENKSRGNGLVDHSQSPANPKAKKQKRKDMPNMPTGGSTNLTYMKGYVGCFEPLKGHFAKVHADALEKKFKAASGLSAQEKIEWEEDIQSWRDAQAAGVDRPEDPDPDNPYRWQDRLTREERQQINKTHNDFNNKIMKQCGDKPSGL